MKIFRYNHYLVYKYINTEININEIDKVKKLNKSDILKSKFLSERKDIFLNFLENKLIGFGIYNEKEKDFVGYSWLSIKNYSKKNPDQIKKLPEKSAWIFYQRVSENYQGHGYQKIMIQKSIDYVNKNFKGYNIYIDTREDNIPSRKNILKSGFKEDGILTNFIIGSKRSKLTYIQINIWEKNKKHPDL